MTPRHVDPELDDLIDEITVDAHDIDEQLMGFEAAFDEDANLPSPAPWSVRKSRFSPSAAAITARN
jgi:hypothetical protein